MTNSNSDLFSILTEVGSTNNYATGQARAGLAKHGFMVVALNQTEGKGQRGKSWLSLPGESLTASLIIQPGITFQPLPFCVSAAVAISVVKVLQAITAENFLIKWPNDIYFNDKKAGGILIENIFSGSDWKFAVCGIGLNLNQAVFPEHLPNPVSLKQITGKSFDAVEIAKLLQQEIVAFIESVQPEYILKEYNRLLYKRSAKVRFKKDQAVFETTISHADKYGKLHTTDTIERSFDFGEISWII